MTRLKLTKLITSGKIIKKIPDYRNILTKKEPHKPLTIGKKEKAGRSKGKITVRHRGGGVKKKYRIIDFYYIDKLNVPAKVESIEYDPNRTAFIALICYKDGERRYIIAPEGIKPGDEIITKEKAPLKTGNRMKLKNIPAGYPVYNIELTPGSGAKLIRSAGSFAQVLSQEGDYTVLQMPSREIRKIPSECFATIGQVSNIEHNKEIIGKAGRKRKKGIRPTVRGKAMNPVDHPHGGGEGRAPIGLKYPKTKWGKPAKFVRTRKKHKASDKLIIKRRYNNK